MNGGVLNEAYERFHTTGPEWGEDQLTNHGPMAAEVLVRRGRAGEVDRWVDRYLRRLDDLPSAGDTITEENWREAWGQGGRVGDWTGFFVRQLDQRPWRDVLATWWPRLLPAIAAGTTHGVIRVGHVVRTLLNGPESEAAVAELAHGLGFWAARARSIPVSAEPAGQLDAGAALDALPRIPHQQGSVANRLGQLVDLNGWSATVAALQAPTDPGQVPDQLADLVTAATLRYLTHGHASPILLVHTATAPNAVLHTLPALPPQLWVPSLSAVWTVVCAVYSGYAPEGPGRSEACTVSGGDPVADVLDRAIAHGDEHVIKFTDTAAEVYARTGHPGSLAAARHITTLIQPS